MSCKPATTLPWSSLSYSQPGNPKLSDYAHVLLSTQGQEHGTGDISWKMYCTASFTTAMAIVMAELTRQIEVQCSERAHALALTWNSYSAALDTCLGKPCL